MSSVVLGIDVGTTGVRTLAVAPGGQILAAATAEYPMFSPHVGWAEQEPEHWWQAVVTTVRAAVQQLEAPHVAAIGLSGQMHGAVFLDRTGVPIRPAPLWCDQRTANECDELTAAVGAGRLQAITGNPALTGFQAPKILWLRNHEPKRYERVAHVLLPKDYIRYRLSGDWATDASDAAGTLLLDIHTRDWSAEILDRLEIPREWMPMVHEGPETTGSLSAEAATVLGLPPGIPIVAGGGDNAAAAVGAGAIRPGTATSSIGTSGVISAHSDRAVDDPRGRIHVFCHAVPGAYQLLYVTLAAGGSMRWFRDTLGADLLTAAEEAGIDPYDLITREAESVPPGAGGLLFLPYLMGERSPHVDPRARGGFVGLTARHGRENMARAVMEGVVYSLRQGLELMQDLGIDFNQVLAVGGGARSRLWRELQADIFEVPVAQPSTTEGPAYGAALLAAVGAGWYGSVYEACDEAVGSVDVIPPSERNRSTYRKAYEIYCSLYPRLYESMHALSNLDKATDGLQAQGGVAR